MKLVLVSMFACGAAACGGGATPKSVANVGTTAAAGDIHAVDWANRTYQSGDGTFTVKDGAAEFGFDEDGNEVAPDYQPKDPDGFVEHGYFNVAPPHFGDANGDGAVDALVVHVYNGGGTGQFDGITVFTMQGGQPVVLGEIPGGDRGDGGDSDATIDGGVVLVDRMMSGPDDGACCPSKLQQERWTWNGGGFVEDEAARRLVDMPQ
jgi:hypothetical protein